MDDSSMDLTAGVGKFDVTKQELLSEQDKSEALLQNNHDLKNRIEVLEGVNRELINEFNSIVKLKAESDLSNLQNELELVSSKVILQEKYDLKKKIEVMEKVTCDLDNELSFLNDEKTKDKLKILDLQSKLEFANVKSKKLETLLEDERLNLQIFIKENKNIKNESESNKALVVPDQEQLNILTTQIENFEKLQEEQLQVIQLLTDEKSMCNHTIQQLKYEKQCLQDELIEIKEHLLQKTNDLRTKDDTLENLREEKLLLSTEVQMLKSSGSASRGNSLFAEIEENRKKVAAQLEVLKFKYLNLKKALSKKQVENNQLKSEIIKIRREEQEEEKSIHHDYSDLLKTYKTRISELEERLNTLEKHSDQHPVTGLDADNSRMSWVSTVVENAREETRTLQAELDRRGSNYVVQAHQLFDSQKGNRKLKAINMKLQSEIDELRLTLDTIKSANENVDDGNSPPATNTSIACQKLKMVTFKVEAQEDHHESLPEDKDSDKENDMH